MENAFTGNLIFVKPFIVKLDNPSVFPRITARFFCSLFYMLLKKETGFINRSFSIFFLFQCKYLNSFLMIISQHY